MADRFWIAGTAGNWNDTANWSTSSGGAGGASVPGSADVAKFDGNGVGDCAMNVNVDVLGIDVASGYTGTVTQQASITIIVGSSDWVQAGGTFSGGDSRIDIDGVFSQTGGTFTSTSGELHVGSGQVFSGGTDLFTQTGGTFNHNNGTVVFDGLVSSAGVIWIQVSTSITLYDVKVNASSGGDSVGVRTGDVVIVENDLTHQSRGMQGEWELQGNLFVKSGANGAEDLFLNNARITFNGTGDQEYDVQSPGTTIGIKIDKATGTVTPAVGTTTLSCAGKFEIAQGTFTAPTGTFDFANVVLSNGGTLFTVATGTTYTANGGLLWLHYRISGVGGTVDVDLSGTATLADVKIETDDKFAVPAAQTMTCDDLTFTAGTDATGDYNVRGDLSVAAGFGSLSTATFTFSGAEHQSVDFNAETVGDIDLDKSAGTVTLAGSVTASSWTGTDGDLDINGNTLTVSGDFIYPGTNATAVKDTAATGLIDVDGTTFAIDNVTWTDADLDVAEATPIASNCAVSNSDASAGSEIDATDNCTDNGGNTNWNFGTGASNDGAAMYHHLQNMGVYA